MKIHYLKQNQIIFTYCNYPSTLQESIKRIGITFPLRIKKQGMDYVCIDGHKRLSVLHNLNSELEIPVLIEGDGSMRTQSSWSQMNHH